MVGAVVGAEGTAGIVTRATLRILREPEAHRTMLAVFADVEGATRAVSTIIASGIVPGAIEMMDALSIESSEKSAKAGFPMRGAALLVELDGSERECDARFEEVTRICERNGSDDVRVAQDEDERQRACVLLDVLRTDGFRDRGER